MTKNLEEIKMKKLIAIIFSILIIFPSVTFAAWDFSTNSGLVNTAGNAGYSGGSPDEFPETIGKYISIFLSFLGVIFLILMIYGGFLWMTAAGEESKVEDARKIIRNAIIGLVIIISAYGITEFVAGLTKKNLGELQSQAIAQPSQQ